MLQYIKTKDMTKHKAIKQLPIKDRYKISKSDKDFIILRSDKSYILTNDLVKHRAEYMSKGGQMFCLPTIKKDL
jgi:hypothetical protein